MKQKIKPLLPLISLPLIFLVCLGFWFNLTAIQYVHVRIQDGLWDLREFDFENDIAGLYGGVEFIPGALLTPEEFAARADEIIVGSAQIGSGNSFATSRVRLLMPGDGHYTFSRMSTYWNDRIFVNGIWLYDVGTPSPTAAGEVARIAHITFTARPEYVNGYYVIEILHQNSNFFHRIDGGPQWWRVGGAGSIYISRCFASCGLCVWGLRKTKYLQICCRGCLARQ